MKNISTKCNLSETFRSGEFSVISKSFQQTRLIGYILAENLGNNVNIGLFGDLGTGKTQLVKGIARGIRIEEDEIVSPGFGLINVYEGDKKLYHVDLYRLETPTDIATIGLDEIMEAEGICVIEWAERLREESSFLDILIRLSILEDNTRILRFGGKGLAPFKNALRKM